MANFHVAVIANKTVQPEGSKFAKLFEVNSFQNRIDIALSISSKFNHSFLRLPYIPYYVKVLLKLHQRKYPQTPI